MKRLKGMVMAVLESPTYDKIWRWVHAREPRAVYMATKEIYRQAAIKRGAPVNPGDPGSTASETYLGKAAVYAGGRGMTRFTKRYKFRAIDLLIGGLNALIGIGLALQEGNRYAREFGDTQLDITQGTLDLSRLIMERVYPAPVAPAETRMLFNDKIWTVFTHIYVEDRPERNGKPDPMGPRQMLDFVVKELRHKGTIQAPFDNAQGKQAEAAIKQQIAEIVGVPPEEVNIVLNASKRPVTVESVLEAAAP